VRERLSRALALSVLLLAGSARAGEPLVLRRLTLTAGLEGAGKQQERAAVPEWGGTVVTRSFSACDRDHVCRRVVEHELGARGPRDLSRYLARWRAHHHCAVKLVRDLPPLRLGVWVPPQLTFAGSCEGGDFFVIRVVHLGDTGYELHADWQLRVGGADGSQRLRPVLRALLSEIKLTPRSGRPLPHPGASPPRP